MNPRAILAEANRTWKPPAELRRSRPRETELTWSGRILASLAISLLVGGIACGALIFSQAAQEREGRQLLLTQGRRTEARVVRRWTTGGRSPVYRVEIVYEAAGSALRETARIGQNRWRALEEGSRVQICYLAEDPRKFLVLGEPPELSPLWLTVIVGGILIAGWLVARVLIGQRLLLREGRPALGVITSHSSTKNGKVIRYSFLTLGGSIVSGRSGPLKSPPPVGGLQCVLYEPDKVKHNGAYPLELVRPARFHDRV
jgi:hypothetical protein